MFLRVGAQLHVRLCRLSVRAGQEMLARANRVCGVLSLRHFRLASWRSLSLGGGGRDSGVATPYLDSGRSVGRTSRCTNQAARAGRDALYAVLSLPNFRLPRSWTLSLSAAARRTTPAAAPAANDGARALDNDQLRGHRQQIEKSPALTVGRLTSLAQRCVRKDQQNLAELTTCVVRLARARRTRLFSDVGQQADPRSTFTSGMSGKRWSDCRVRIAEIH